MVLLLSALIIAGALVWGALRVARELASPKERRGEDLARLLAVFAPAVKVSGEPRSVLAWQPLAVATRKLFPAEFEALDRAWGTTFPFTPEQVQAAHSRWTAQWLAWERAHDARCKLEVARVEHELGDQVATPYGRARLDAVERHKLERYQHRYEEYTRVSKALQALFERR